MAKMLIGAHFKPYTSSERWDEFYEQFSTIRNATDADCEIKLAVDLIESCLQRDPKDR